MKNIWILIAGFFLINLNPASAQLSDNVQISRYAGIPAQAKVNDILVDQNNRKWLATNLGVYKVSSFKSSAEKVIENEALALTISRNDEIWAGFANGDVINLMTNQSIKLETPQSVITSMAVSKGQIWIGTDNGLFIYSTNSNKQSEYFHTSNSKLKSNNIKFVFFENQSICWVGTDKGIARVNEMNWKYYDKSISMQAISSNLEGVWLANEKELFVIDSDNRWYPAGMSKGLHVGDIKEMTIDKQGKLYLASEVLVRFDPYTEKTERYGEEIGFISTQCLSIQTDLNDNIWVGTEDSGLYRLRFSDEEDPEFEELTAVCFIEHALNCDGDRSGIIKVVSKGGVEPYAYSWNNSNQNSETFQNLGEGNYSVTVTDAVENSFATNIELSTPPPIIVSLLETTAVSSVGKSDGTAKIEISGGSRPYSVEWDNGNTSLNPKKLSAGLHTVKVQDANNCIANLDIDIAQPKILPELELSQLKVGQTLQIKQLFFEADSSSITQTSTPVLNEIYEFMLRNKGIIIEIGGHTNNIPPHEYCDRLSTERARTVATYLFNKGVESGRISYKGYGKRLPIATNQSIAGRRKNQRVELKILEIQ